MDKNLFGSSLQRFFLWLDNILTARTQSNGIPDNGDQTWANGDQNQGFNDQILSDKIAKAIEPLVKEVQRLTKEVN